MHLPVPAPDFSVVVTTMERPVALGRLLDALNRQQYDHSRFEVIVVNDGGTTPLEALVDSFRGHLRIALINQPNAGPASGRNTGIARAKGQYIAFTDDDCEPAAEWLMRLFQAHTDFPGAMIGGRIINGLPDNLCSAASQRIVDLVYSFYNATANEARFFTTNNISFPARTMQAIGGLDRQFRIASEDRDLSERWRMLGHRMVFEHRAIVRHYHHLTLASFWRQQFNYGQGAVRFHRVRAANQSSQLKEHTSFHANWREWLFAPWRESHSLASVQMIALLSLWQVANVAGCFYRASADLFVRKQ